MAFAEYHGGGKAGSDISSMARMWDVEWSQTSFDGAVDVLVTSENWSLIERHLPPPRRVLEAGCGLGLWVKFLQDRGYEAHGVDFSTEGIASARRRWPGLKVMVADLRAMPYESGCFDAVVSLGVIEHDIAGPAAILAEMRRVLAPGGILYCTVPCFSVLRRAGVMWVWNWVVCNHTIRRLTGRRPETAFFEYLFTPREYKALLTQAGFEVASLVPLGPSVWMTGHGAGLRRKVVDAIHRGLPWLMPHMMVAVCRNPQAVVGDPAIRQAPR
jgi:SAM-dependent methyltransferase